MNPDTTHAEPVDVTINRLERELAEKTNDVARLRELLNRALGVSVGLGLAALSLLILITLSIWENL